MTTLGAKLTTAWEGLLPPEVVEIIVEFLNIPARMAYKARATLPIDYALRYPFQNMQRNLGLILAWGPLEAMNLSDIRERSAQFYSSDPSRNPYGAGWESRLKRLFTSPLWPTSFAGDATKEQYLLKDTYRGPGF